MQHSSVFFLTLLMISTMSVQAKMYKWVDENGQTHFGDKIPAQYLDKGHKEMSEQGTTIKKVDAAPTQEEKIEMKKQAKLKKEEENKIKEQKKQDRVLLDTYTTERDLTAARDARLEAVEAQVLLSESILKDAGRKLGQTKKQIANIKSHGNEVPKNVSDKITKEKNQLATYEKVAEGHRERKKKIMEQFDGYIKRFRELKAESNRIKEERKARRDAA
jgi:hypothetical protein